MSIEEILQLAKEIDASDIHMAPGSPVLFRVNGCLVPQKDELVKPTDVNEAMKAIMTKEQFAELERKGEMDFVYSIAGFSRVRVNVFRQRGTYAASLRILSYEVPLPDTLGIPASFVELTNRKRGLVLVTGTAGSGKSTTLASLVEVIAERDYKNIITIEDSIEYLHSHKKSIVSQREIGVDIDNYANGIRAALRQDPDVIVVGEMYDTDTISMALAAAETGHLVLSTLHTSNTADALARIIDVFPPHQQQQIRVQLASLLCGVIAQQLLPSSDIHGRIAAYEVLLATPEVRNMIRDNKNHHLASYIAKNRKAGMQTMDDAILDAYMSSRIDMETAISCAQDSERMEQKVRIF